MVKEALLDLVQCSPFQLDYFLNIGESPNLARLVMANSEQDLDYLGLFNK